jgi:predicted NACHT family NTPase
LAERSKNIPSTGFYVILPVTRRISSTDDDADSALTGAGTDAANAINDATHVLLLGGAGAGKTTFLKWLAYTVARDGRKFAVVVDAAPLAVVAHHLARLRRRQRRSELARRCAVELLQYLSAQDTESRCPQLREQVFGSPMLGFVVDVV